MFKEKGVELKCHYHNINFNYKTDKYSLPITDLVSSQQVSLLNLSGCGLQSY